MRKKLKALSNLILFFATAEDSSQRPVSALNFIPKKQMADKAKFLVWFVASIAFALVISSLS